MPRRGTRTTPEKELFAHGTQVVTKHGVASKARERIDRMAAPEELELLVRAEVVLTPHRRGLRLAVLRP